MAVPGVGAVVAAGAPVAGGAVETAPGVGLEPPEPHAVTTSETARRLAASRNAFMDSSHWLLDWEGGGAAG
jgi:hypothetical protein